MTVGKRPTPAEQLVEVMTRIYERRLTTPSGGNLSILDDDGDLWVTPRQLDKGRLLPSHMVRIRSDDSWTSEFAPTSEWPFHRAILQARQDCRAVVHAHPTSLVAFSVVGKELSLDGFPDLRRWIHRVGTTAYAIPGSKKLGQLLGETFAAGCDATLMENHGAVACGPHLMEAFHRFEAMEHLATILIGAERLGGLRLPSDEQMKGIAETEPSWEAVDVDVGPQATARATLADYIRRAYGRGLLGSVAGAFSVRCGNGFLVAADGADSATVQPDELVYVEDGSCQSGRVPNRMAELHRSVYQARPHVQAVATALPPHLMAFAATGVPFDARTIPEAYMFLKTVPTLPFAARLDGALTAAALDEKTPVLLIEGACAVVTGASPFPVFDRLEVAESTARSIIDAAAIGRMKPLADDVLEEIRRVYGC